MYEELKLKLNNIIYINNITLLYLPLEWIIDNLILTF